MPSNNDPIHKFRNFNNYAILKPFQWSIYLPLKTGEKIKEMENQICFSQHRIFQISKSGHIKELIDLQFNSETQKVCTEIKSVKFIDVSKQFVVLVGLKCFGQSQNEEE